MSIFTAWEVAPTHSLRGPCLEQTFFWERAEGTLMAWLWVTKATIVWFRKSFLVLLALLLGASGQQVTEVAVTG